MKELPIAIIGTQFMGKAHSNAYIHVPHFFNLPLTPVMQLACGLNKLRLQQFSAQFGWKNIESNWKKLVLRDDVDLIDIATANNLHAPIAIAASKAGKHLLCEKPMARNADEARRMYEAAATSGKTHAMIFNYRFIPAIAHAKEMMLAGKIGKIHHFNAVYYQDWLVDPTAPLVWRHDAKTSGSGAHGDMNAHIVDLARYLIGEFEAVSGVQKIFIPLRTRSDGNGVGKVTTDDACSFFAHFQNGALGSFQSTRFGTGYKNFLRLEIFGSEGALQFNLERLNELKYYSTNDVPTDSGFRNILMTHQQHPFLKAWWPEGHMLGWEHSFIHEIYNLLLSIDQEKKLIPDFYDGLKCMEVLDAVSRSIRKGKWVSCA
jgi:predicted dehydrogenase